jgi:ABC-type glycerol-3-phosphate transport system substrate-binding protein
MSGIDPSSPVPLYYQLKTLLEQQIKGGALLPGDKIPTEAELCEQYQISRTPVRQALAALRQEGLLTSTAGRGTFVTLRPEQHLTLRIIIPDGRWQWPLLQAARLWNERQTPAHLDLSFDIVPLSRLHDHLSLAVAQGNAPDISVLDSVWVAEFAHRRYLCPLSQINEQWVAEIRQAFYPAVLHANSYQDELYAVPTNTDAAVLWYRHDWFEAEGLKPPATWQQLLEAAHHFRRPAVRSRYGLQNHPLIFAAGRRAGETTTYQLLPFLWSNGGDMLRDATVALNSTHVCEALTFLRHLVEKEIVSGQVTQTPWDGSLRAFARGEVALAFGGTYENYLIQEAGGWDSATFAQRAGFVPLPAGPRGKPATLVGGMTYGIYRQSTHASAALALLQLALSPSVLKPFSLRTAQNPSLQDVAQEIGPQEHPFLYQTSRLVAQAGSRPSLAAYDLVSTQFQEMVELVITGALPAETAAHRAAERIAGITGLPLPEEEPFSI